MCKMTAKLASLCTTMKVMTENSKARLSRMCTTSTVDTVQSHIIDTMCTEIPLSAHPALAVKRTLRTGLHTYERQVLSRQTDRQADREADRKTDRAKRTHIQTPQNHTQDHDIYPFRCCQPHLATGVLQAHLITCCKAEQAALTLENIVIKIPLLLPPSRPALVIKITVGRDDV